MSAFAVEYVYSPDSADVRDKHRPAHRAWLASLVEDGRVLATGPFVDGTGALLIFKTDTEDALNRLLTDDPFNVAGGIAGLKVTEWNPMMGLLSTSL